jgi:hypothetical protein
MNSLEINGRRALSIWWSFIWRSWLCTLPICFVGLALMRSLIPMPLPHKPGEPPHPFSPADMPSHYGAKFGLLWVFMMGGMIICQTLAMRWALKTKWSDFKLVAVPANDGGSH